MDQLSVGGFTNSLLSAKNGDTFALANANFDFSLLKLEAPKEYSSFGTALTMKRRQSAEYGAMHQTARKLGALFANLVPSTPKLIGIYGKRVSQIMHTPGINPRGSGQHGPFADFVGADGTTI